MEISTSSVDVLLKSLHLLTQPQPAQKRDYCYAATSIFQHEKFLILLEYALWVQELNMYLIIWFVLILVLMEYALWERIKMTKEQFVECLNPCCNGICSMRILKQEGIWQKERSLNPCFNGSTTYRLKSYWSRFICCATALRAKARLLLWSNFDFTTKNSLL